MARSINSPGIQITETDLSFNQQIGGGTVVLVPGYAPQGPSDDVLQVSTISEFEQIYGTPTTEAERYFYYSCKEVLNSPATLLTTRLPYGSGSGAGFTTQYSALLYPVLSATDGNFTVQTPTHITLSETDYNKILQNNFNWSTIGTDTTATAKYDSANSALSAGIVVLNSGQTTINEGFEGYYVSIGDNVNFGPDTDFNQIFSVNGLTATDSFTSLPTTRLGFTLTASYVQAGTGSISETIETIPTYNFSDPYFNDSLIVTVFKVRNSLYEPQSLSYSLAESFIGSLDADKKTVNQADGSSVTYFLQDVVNNKSSNIKVLINPNLALRTNWTGVSSSTPSKSVRNSTANKALYSVGVLQPTYAVENNKIVGDVIQKLERSFTHVNTIETTPIDIVVDAGLSTIATNTSAYFYADTFLSAGQALSASDTPTALSWRAVFNSFNNFVANTRKDCVFISDPLRQIFVNGADTKVLNVRGATFTQNIYTPLKSLYAAANSNYSVVYANWLKTYDVFTNKQVWVPSSAYAAAIYARSDAATQPWIAPAGLNRGVINNVTDIAFNPNQKQRDFLYTLSINPVVLFSGSGYTIFGQKTLQNKPSAFDRVNVRRLFLTLERAVGNSLKFFIFEPNTEFTRTRLKNAITPIFELAKNTEGLYDYQIVCDERNNTPDLIDRNELAVDIYVKPVRAAEFILVNFIATRTGQNFQELI